MAGSTSSVRSVLEIRPPITTVARGFCTSAPVPVARAMGTKPSEATSAVMRTGRSRVRHPRRIAASRGKPSRRNWLMNETMTSPLSTATPERAMNPTAAEIEKGRSRTQRATIPPVSPSGTQVKTSSAYLTLLNVLNSSRKMRKKQTGTTMVRRSLAATRFS